MQFGYDYVFAPLTFSEQLIIIIMLGFVAAEGSKKCKNPLDNPDSFCYYNFAHGGIAQLGARLKRVPTPVWEFLKVNIALSHIWGYSSAGSATHILQSPT